MNNVIKEFTKDTPIIKDLLTRAKNRSYRILEGKKKVPKEYRNPAYLKAELEAMSLVGAMAMAESALFDIVVDLGQDKDQLKAEISLLSVRINNYIYENYGLGGYVDPKDVPERKIHDKVKYSC